ncbi:MAG: hypothetical protein JOY61_22325 [Chloroflexi bacterium]|nr:hypothetical protein [Chloroflexota bacterium]
MRITTGRIDSGNVDELRKLAPDLVAAVRRMPGCQSFTGGVDRASGRTITVSTWDTQEHAGYAAEALGDVVQKIRAAGTQIDPPQVFEVITQ